MAKRKTRGRLWGVKRRIARLVTPRSRRMAPLALQMRADYDWRVDELEPLARQVTELCEKGEFATALPLAIRAGDLVGWHCGDEDPEYADWLNDIALIYQDLGDNDAAMHLHRGALEIRRAALGPNDRSYAASLVNLASLCRIGGAYSEAEPLFREGIEILKSSQDGREDYATGIMGLGNLYFEVGAYEKAEPLYREALAARREVLDPMHPACASSLNALAVLYAALSNYRAAAEAAQDALAILRVSVGEMDPRYAESLGYLADIYQAVGDRQAAEPLYLEAATICRSRLGERHARTAMALRNLGVFYLVGLDYEEARPLLDQASMVARSVFGEGHQVYGNALLDLAVLQMGLREYGAAERSLREASDIFRRTLGDKHPMYAATLNNRALLYEITGDFRAAEPLLREATESLRAALGEGHPMYAWALNGLAWLLAATSREREALNLMQKTGDIEDLSIRHFFAMGSERQRMEFLRMLEKPFNAYLSLITQRFQDDLRARQTAIDLVLRRKGIGAELLAAQREAVLSGRYPELAGTLEELTAVHRQIAQKTLAGPGREDPESYQRLLAQWNDQSERLEAELAQQIPEVNLEERVRRANRQAVADSLPTGSALVEFVRLYVVEFEEKAAVMRSAGDPLWNETCYMAFVLQSAKPNDVRMFDLGDANVIDAMISEFRAEITGADTDVLEAEQPSPSPSPSPEDGSALRAAVFDPLLAGIGECRRLFVAADGDLNRLAFEALPSSDGRRLIDDFRISYVSVGRDVVRFGEVPVVHASEPIVIADPDFDLSCDEIAAVESKAGSHSRVSPDYVRSGVRFRRLKGVRLEGERIARHLGVEPWLNSAALEARLKACTSPLVLHIATHGFFLEEEPRALLHPGAPDPVLNAPGGGLGRLSHALSSPMLRSGLALAGANSWLEAKSLPAEAEDGILTAEDVSGLDLLATELVVLSACETGLGEIRAGEGVFGLRRAFVLAGAKTLVMSLWKVPDAQTRELMEDYYHRLEHGQSRGEALRLAQLSLKKKYPDPYFWAAYICQGDPGPLSLPSPTSSQVT
jgi:tetratricopeptide (TPR) repeat protein